MAQLKVPTFGESIVEGTLVRWLKEPGMQVKVDEPLVEIETDKITVEVPSPVAGVLADVSAKVGDKVHVGDVIGEVREGATAEAKPEAAKAAAPKVEVKAETKAQPAKAEPVLMPAARRLAQETGADVTQLQGSGRGGRVLKEDVVGGAQTAAAQAPKLAVAPSAPPRQPTGERERRVTMSPLRKRIAERLLQAQSQAAILTTFNEVDMGAVMALRKRYQEKFEGKHGIKLGFMSFFVKASVEALRAFPSVNGEISGDDIIYKDYYDIGVAVGGGKGLVVPVLRNADQLGFADVEKSIADLAGKAKNNKLSLEEMQGGTFSITNGGIYGSMLSTPILNPPQSGILGMHNIQERAMVRDGQVTVRPMMYLALSYDHRLVDGREAVSFLVRVKECIEDPERLLLEV
jgi:2-oxoglutarate dehydrogenase E2 component (dihydrolipoamide succinyltransferase)